MSLVRLELQNIRNISSVSLDLDKKLNLFVGSNGSGKTSLLEAVYFLGSARSFRSLQIESLINHQQSDCTVFGVVHSGARDIRIGVHRGLNGFREIKVAGHVQSKASVLAREMPVLVLGPETVDLLLSTPSTRRRFLNWGVFHMEPDFSDTWVSVNRTLKQRNELLKRQGSRTTELDIWTSRLVDLSELVHTHRELYCNRLSAVFTDISSSLSGLQEVKCEYSRGWDAKRNLKAVLEDQMDSDLHRGFTQSGLHRADLKISVAGHPVATVCSRGELKVLAWALVLSQAELFSGVTGRQLIFLVDDLVSELDEAHRRRICQFLMQREGQVLATGLDREVLKACWNKASAKVFHVERGHFTEEEN